MFGNKFKSNKTGKKEAKPTTKAEHSPQKETGKLAEAETKHCKEAVECKPMLTSDKGAYKVYENNDREQNTYYFERRALTDAKLKQDSYAGVQQFYQRKDRIVGSGFSQEREYPQGNDEEIVNSEITCRRTDRDMGELPPDYGTLYPEQTEDSI